MKIYHLAFLGFMSFNSDVSAQKDDEIFLNGFDLNVVADIVSVSVTGSPNQYTLSVGVLSPDIDCTQYADWWEILSEGQLINRRILGHSHATEQPFIRSLSSVNIEPQEIIWVRAHMNNAGYGGAVFVGSVDTGFALTETYPDWPAVIEFEEPQVTSCAF